MSEYAEFDLESAARIARATRRVEGMPPPSETISSKVTMPVQILRITGAIDNTTGLYPAKAYGYVHEGDGTDQFTELLAECRVKALEGASFAENDWTLGRFSGKSESEPFGVFVAFAVGEIVRWVKPVSATPDYTGGSTNYWLAHLQIKSGGVYQNAGASPTVALMLECGNRVIASQKYQGTLNGTIEIDDVTYPLYHIEGNVGEILEVCVDGVAQFDRFDFRAPFQRVGNVDETTGEPL